MIHTYLKKWKIPLTRMLGFYMEKYPGSLVFAFEIWDRIYEIHIEWD